MMESLGFFLKWVSVRECLGLFLEWVSAISSVDIDSLMSPATIPPRDPACLASQYGKLNGLSHKLIIALPFGIQTRLGTHP